MQYYKTIEEKAAEWNITPRHAQYLCRNGKIEGAVKRAGAWFIPNNTPVPIKNTKSDALGFEFVGTKNKIFNSAIKLFMLKGFNAVSLRDIAESIGIRQSTIYNHFKSKQEILDTIYDFYCHHYLKGRPSLKDMETITRDKSLIDIISCIRYDFNEDYEQRMSDITKIIFQRIAIDERARKIGKSLMAEEGIKYVEDVFNRAIKIGRFAPFDTHAMAVFINCIRIFTLFNWIVDPAPDSLMKLAADEQTLYRYATTFVKSLETNN